MITAIEYALMAGHAYRTTRDEINWFPVPLGWTPFSPVPDPATASVFPVTAGFEAISFSKGTQIVISFAGTNPGDIFGDMAANLSLAGGHGGSSQLRQAADYYLQVRAANPGATITFTGHSLGGGLASLMAVFFGETAFTFDQAPFSNSARTYTTTDPNTGITTTTSVAQDLLTYLTGQTTNGQPVYLPSQLQGLSDFVTASANSATLIPNAEKVTNINVQGEFLSSWYLVPSSNRIGSQIDIEQQNNMGFPANIPLVASINLHSQALLAAFKQSDATAPTVDAQSQSLSQVTFKLNDLLKMIFDDKLFAYPANTTNTTDPNFLELIVNHEAGRDPIANATITPDAMVTRFTSDLWKLTQPGGLTLIDELSTGDNYLSKTMIAFAMQKYYEETQGGQGYKQELFTDISSEGGTGGIRFDITDISPRLKTEYDTRNESMELNKQDENGEYLLKGYSYFSTFLDSYYTSVTNDTVSNSPDKNQILSMISFLRDWYIQAGAGGMIATDTQNRGAFIPHLPSLAEDKNLFEVLGNAVNETDYANQLERKAA